MVNHAEAFAHTQVFIGGVYGCGILQGKAGFISIKSRTEIVTHLQCFCQIAQRFCPFRNGTAELISKNGRIGSGTSDIPACSLTLRFNESRTAQAHPDGAVFFGDRHNPCKINHSRRCITGFIISLCGTQQFCDFSGRLFSSGQFIAIGAGLIQHTGRYKCQRRWCSKFNLYRSRVKNLTGNSALNGIHLTIIGLQKAPFRFHIIGKSAAFLIFEANIFALFKTDIFDCAQIKTGIITVLRGCNYP